MKAAHCSNDSQFNLEGDVFEQFDAFLTGLIVSRAPVNVRTGLKDYFKASEKKSAKPRAKAVRKTKIAFAAA